MLPAGESPDGDIRLVGMLDGGEITTKYGASGFVWGFFTDDCAGINRVDNPTKAGRLSVTD